MFNTKNIPITNDTENELIYTVRVRAAGIYEYHEINIIAKGFEDALNKASNEIFIKEHIVTAIPRLQSTESYDPRIVDYDVKYPFHGNNDYAIFSFEITHIEKVA
jgi:hypothetical protein